MRVLAKFLLSSVFLLLPAAGVVPLCAQHYRGALPSSYQELRDYDSIGVRSDEQKAIEDLEKRVETAEHALKEMQFNGSIYAPNLMVDQIDDNRKKLLTVETKLYETEDRLAKAEATITALDLRLLALEASKHRASGNKPKPAKMGSHESRGSGSMTSKTPSPQLGGILAPSLSVTALANMRTKVHPKANGAS